MPHIRFRHTVTSAEPQPDGSWRIGFTDAEGKAGSARFDALMVANGHHWAPKHPEYPGRFTGIYMHSHDFKGIDDGWRGQSVLVIGAGNSACDIAVESARLAGTVCLSMRSPQWFVPKFMFGKPSDVTGAALDFLPRRVKQWLMTGMLRLASTLIPVPSTFSKTTVFITTGASTSTLRISANTCGIIGFGTGRSVYTGSSGWKPLRTLTVVATIRRGSEVSACA